MTKMYLLWEWTEEREGKILHGIYTTVEKAKAAAALDYKETEAGVELDWTDPTYGELTGVKNGDYHEEYPYEISPFDVDTFEIYRYGPGTENPTREQFTL